MPRRKVYVIWNHPLFDESVRLLLKHPNIEFVGGQSDHRVAIQEIADLQPDTILLEESGGDSNQAIKILEYCFWEVQVVLISLADNLVNLYHHEQKMVGKTDDLFQLVLGKTYSQ